MEKELEDIRKKSIERLIELRKENNLSMEKFADIIGVTKAAIFQWEHGNRASMKTKYVKIISQKFDVSPLWVMGFDVPKANEDVLHEDLRKNISDKLIWFSMEQLRYIDKFITDFIEPNVKKE